MKNAKFLYRPIRKVDHVRYSEAADNLQSAKLRLDAPLSDVFAASTFEEVWR